MKTITYSCSGCSNVAQLANKIAVKLDREKISTMSCIAGIGGDVLSLIKVAKNAEKIIALDGCALECALNCLKRHQIIPDTHIILTNFKLTKNMHSDFSKDEFQIYYEKVKNIVEQKQSSITDE